MTKARYPGEKDWPGAGITHNMRRELQSAKWDLDHAIRWGRDIEEAEAVADATWRLHQKMLDKYKAHVESTKPRRRRVSIPQTEMQLAETA